MSWLLLIIAGLLEVGWASVLPAAEGFTRPMPTVAFLVLLVASMFLLAKASEQIPLGTAYAVWVGVGAVGAALVGIVVRHEPATAARMVF
ncbi:MAG TPA: multidrug efflux SMR transporter, partial [Ilumatobacteraceae bacterium]|nr:multidrug efflux SMR transporter [Ilumatobacteraceae bacterium]